MPTPSIAAATITPGGTYRLRGKRGSLRLSVLAQVAPPTDPNDGPRAHLNLAELKTDADGRYDVLLSAERPAGYAGDWWQLDPKATRLMLRMVSADWGKEAEPTFSLERIDRPMGRKRPPAATLERSLRALPKAIDFIGPLFVAQVEKMRTDGYINKLRSFQAPYGALAGQFYYEGSYDLADDEALIIEFGGAGQMRLPLADPDQRHLRDHRLAQQPFRAQRYPGAGRCDGRLRIVISAQDPGVANWMDTAGYPRGAIQGRWTGCDSQPIPEVRKVKLKDVAKYLPKDTPKVTPEQRQAILRERRRALMERPYW